MAATDRSRLHRVRSLGLWSFGKLDHVEINVEPIMFQQAASHR